MIELKPTLVSFDLEHGSESKPWCSPSTRDRAVILIAYAWFAFVSGVVAFQFSDQDFSAVLTVGAGFQLFAFTLLLYKVNLSQSVAGLSARTLEMYSLFYLLRLTSTCQKNGYIPVDRSGDWLYQVLDAASLLNVLQLLYAVHVRHAATYQSHLDLSVDFWRAVPLLVLLFAAPAAASLRSNATIPITQKVFVEGVEVYGQSAGHGQLNTCESFPRSLVDNAAAPTVKVCGTQTKVTVFLRNRCVKYHEYNVEIGACNTKADTATCEELGPATAHWMQTAQSYMIEQCATGTQ